MRCYACDMQVKAREETLARDEERHQQLKEESKKQVSSPPDFTAVHPHFCTSPIQCSFTHHQVQHNKHHALSTLIHFKLHIVLSSIPYHGMCGKLDSCVDRDFEFVTLLCSWTATRG